jgi:hypothetical protein
VAVDAAGDVYIADRHNTGCSNCRPDNATPRPGTGGPRLKVLRQFGATCRSPYGTPPRCHSRGPLTVPSAPTCLDEPNLSVAITDYAQDQIGKRTGQTK